MHRPRTNADRARGDAVKVLTDFRTDVARDREDVHADLLARVKCGMPCWRLLRRSRQDTTAYMRRRRPRSIRYVFVADMNSRGGLLC